MGSAWNNDPTSKDYLLEEHCSITEMERLYSNADDSRKGATSDGVPIEGSSSRDFSGQDPIQYRVYKRRFIGLFQLVLLNIIVSWDVSNNSPFYLLPVHH